MKITFFGTRGGFPVGGQMSCARVETSNGAFVIDLGSTHLFDDPDLVAATDHVLLTHLHPDHITHLAALIIARLNLPAVEGDCLFVAPEPLADYMRFSGLDNLPGWQQTAEVPTRWCGLKLEAHQTNHPKKNYAYKMTEGDRTIVWTGDCTYSRELVTFCQGVDVIICESTLKESCAENAADWGHMTPSLFARLMNEAGPALAVSTHFSQLSPTDFAESVRSQLDDDIDLITASDGFCLDLNN